LRSSKKIIEKYSLLKIYKLLLFPIRALTAFSQVSIVRRDYGNETEEIAGKVGEKYGKETDFKGGDSTPSKILPIFGRSDGSGCRTDFLRGFVSPDAFDGVADSPGFE
jgi:hypothetical protein